jgi:tetratricopeptide (TPR) repeat protein
VEWLALYLGAAWIVWEAVGLTVDTFDLPVAVARVTGVLLGLGALLAIPLAHWYELTARALEGAPEAGPRNVPGVPDVLEPALTRGYRRVRGRTVLLAGAGSTLLFSGLFLALWNAWASDRGRTAPDTRVSLVVFPFRVSGLAGGYGEGVADLLTSTLDGTPGVRVFDPAAMWRPLRPERGAPALAPDAEQAVRLSRRAGARRYVTGAVIGAGSSLDVTARVYDAVSGEPLASVRTTAPADSLAAAVHRLAIDVLSSIWERGQLPTVPEIDRFATSNGDALKAYLEAMSLARSGLYEAAETAIDGAVALDSTFALAHLAQFRIRSRVLFMRAEPFVGLREIIDRAMAHRDRLTPRNRMRVEAYRALDETDGVRAAFLFERILSTDPLDVDALAGLAFTYQRDGWQIGKGWDEIVATYDRLIELDPGSVGARALRANLAIWSDDVIGARRVLSGLRAVDTVSAVARGILGTFRALQAPDSEAAAVLESLANEPPPVVTTILRNLRTTRPDLAERFLIELGDPSRPVTHRRMGLGARVQLWMAQGRLSAVDSVLATGELEAIRSLINLYFVTSALAGVGSAPLARRAVEWLSEYVPAESLLYYFESRPAWPIGWAVGAHEATFGDTAEARVWQRAIGTLPSGGTPLDYREALRSDIEARLAVRRGDLEAAERAARRAYDAWGIHSSYFQDYHPEVALRFHLAGIQRARGAISRAERLYRSLGPPHTWYAFYTARAGFELGRIEEARGNRDAAVRHYLTATRLWERGDPEIVGQWLARAREGLGRLRGERSNGQGGVGK